MVEVFQRINYLDIHPDNFIGFNSIVFNNLEHLTVYEIYDKHLVAISKLEFPKLQSLWIPHNYHGDVIFENLLKSFFNKIKHIKTLDIPSLFDNPNTINIFENFIDMKFYYLIGENNESVCQKWKKWKKCVDKSMEIRINEFYTSIFGNAFRVKPYQSKNDIFLYEINDKNIDTLKVILTKFPKIKHFYLLETLIKGNNILI